MLKKIIAEIFKILGSKGHQNLLIGFTKKKKKIAHRLPNLIVFYFYFLTFFYPLKTNKPTVLNSRSTKSR